jgi:hypothetical protein
MSFDSTSTNPLSRPRRSMNASLRPLSIALALLLSTPPLARAADSSAPIDLQLYGRLLEAHTRAVSDLAGTRVDYRGLRDSNDWQDLVAQLSAARPSQLGPDAKLAFWINAYNILAIDLVRRHYPVESIKDIGSFLFPVWNREVARIEGRDVSLGEIEHEILRPMGEPRIHAAIVCASTSCPPLARTPYRAERIDADLADAMRTWLASTRKGVAIDRSRRIITLSRIFDWFGEDFEAQGGVLTAIAPYLDDDDAAWLSKEGRTGRDVQIRYFDYDWSLNDLSAPEKHP